MAPVVPARATAAAVAAKAGMLLGGAVPIGCGWPTLERTQAMALFAVLRAVSAVAAVVVDSPELLRHLEVFSVFSLMEAPALAKDSPAQSIIKFQTRFKNVRVSPACSSKEEQKFREDTVVWNDGVTFLSLHSQIQN